MAKFFRAPFIYKASKFAYFNLTKLMKSKHEEISRCLASHCKILFRESFFYFNFDVLA